MRPVRASPLLAGRTNIPRMTPSEISPNPPRHRFWQRWAVLERELNLPYVWVMSFHWSRKAAARAFGRRMDRHDQLGTHGLITWIAPVDSEAVHAARADRRISR